MSRAKDYGYINAVLRPRIAQIKSGSLIDSLISSPTLVEAFSKLKDTEYKRIEQVYSATGDIEAVELEFLRHEISEYGKVIERIPKNAGKLIYTLMEKYEIENLKNAIRIWFADRLKGRNMGYRGSYIIKERILRDIDYTAIINAEAWDDIIALLSDTPYADKLSLYDENDLSEKGLFSAEIDLDHIWFDDLKKEIDKLPSKDRKYAKAIYDTDADLKNILMVLRYAVRIHADKDTLERVIIPLGKIYGEIMEAFSYDSPIPAVFKAVEKAYPEVMDWVRNTAGEDENSASDILSVEKYLNDIRSKEYGKVLMGYPFTVGILLAYFFLQKSESAMIRTVLSAKYYHWENSRIREAIGA